MSVRRLMAAAIALLLAVYVRFSMPQLYETAAPAVRQALGLGQLALPVSESMWLWLHWD